MAFRRVLYWMWTSRSELPIRRFVWIPLLTLLGALAGGIDALLDAAIYDLGRNREFFAGLLDSYLWMGGWFGAIVGVCVSVSNRFCLRMAACIAIAPLLIYLAWHLTPGPLVQHYSSTDFHCTKGMTIEGWTHITEAERRRWLVAAARTVASFVVIHHLAYSWLQRQRVPGMMLSMMVGAGIVSGLVFRITGHMVFFGVIEEGTTTVHIETSPSGLTQALFHYLGIVAAASFARRRLIRLPWSPARSPASAASRM